MEEQNKALTNQWHISISTPSKIVVDMKNQGQELFQMKTFDLPIFIAQKSIYSVSNSWNDNIQYKLTAR